MSTLKKPLAKPLYGQYEFVVAADRSTTFKHTSQVLTGSSATNLDWFQSGVFVVNSTVNTTFTFSNHFEWEIVVFLAATGTITVTWPTVSWVGGSPPAAPATGHTTMYHIRYANGVYYGTSSAF